MSETNAPPTNVRPYTIAGVLLLVVGLGGFGTWASMAKLDSGVPAPGMAVVSGSSKTISHLNGGIVAEIHVREAQEVQEGDLLITLDETDVSSRYEAAVQQHAALLARITRLQAEQTGADAIAWPENLAKAGLLPVHVDAQQQVFEARRAALAGDMEVLEQAASAGKADARAKKKQLVLLREELENTRDLVADGFMPKVRLLELQRQELELRNAIDQSQKSARESELRGAKRLSDERKEIDAELATVRTEAGVVAESVRSLTDELRRVEVRSPVSGFVTSLEVHTLGGTIRPGEALMNIVPRGEAMLFEARVPSQYIDRLSLGQSVDIMINAFVDQPDMLVDGLLDSVSAELVEPDRYTQEPPYYLARVKVSDNGWEVLEDRELHPGMPATLMIKTGERTLMQYVLKPLVRRLQTSLSED